MVPFVHIISILKYKEKMTNVTSAITYVIIIKYNFQYKIIQQYKSKNITHRVLLTIENRGITTAYVILMIQSIE